MSSIAEILPPWKGAQNHLQTTWVWIEVSYPVEQPLRCDLLKLILSIRGICPLLWTGEFPARVISKLTSNFEVIMPFAHFPHLFFFPKQVYCCWTFEFICKSSMTFRQNVAGS